MGAVAGERLIYAVVHDFVDAVMEAADGGIADIHGGPFADGFQSFQNHDIAGGIGGTSIGLGHGYQFSEINPSTVSKIAV